MAKRIEIGREPPEVKTELIILLKLSEDRKKYLMASVMDQEKVGDIEIINEETVNEDVEILIRLWTNRELEFKQEELKLKKNFEDLEVILEKMPESKKEQQHQQQEIVIVEEEEEISRDKPAVTGVEKKRSKFRNIKGFFCCFKNREQPKKVYKLEDCGQKLLDSADHRFGTPMQLVSEWTETQVGMWLSGFGMKRYMMEFESKNIRGENLLTLDTNQLKGLGVYERKYRKKILKHIERLQMLEDAIMNFNNEIYNRERRYMENMTNLKIELAM